MSRAHQMRMGYDERLKVICISGRGTKLTFYLNTVWGFPFCLIEMSLFFNYAGTSEGITTTN